jgi:hypothetical protein
VYPEGFDPWQWGEEVETQRRHALKILTAARKELSDYAKVAEELKIALQRIKEEYHETDATKQIEELLETIPIIERMNEIRNELSEKHREETQGRLDRGELKPEVLRIIRNEGLASYEGDNPGASSSNEPKAIIKTFKVIKIEVEEEEPEVPKITLAMITAVILTLVTQLLFMKCKKRNNPVETVNTDREEVSEESSEDDEFEIIPNENEVQEGMTSTQEIQSEETDETSNQTEERREEPTPPIIQQGAEGRRVYVTKAGEKYHLNRGCDSLRGYRR